MRNVSPIILNESQTAIGILDSFTSFIWTERYNNVGDFEIYTPVSDTALNLLKVNYYVDRPGSPYRGIIECVEISMKTEGPMIKATGRMLESIFDRRVIWDATECSGSIQAALKSIIEQNVIKPTEARRKIPNVIFEDSTDPAVTSIEGEIVFAMGDNLLEAIISVCEACSIGFKLIPASPDRWEFSLYAGTDRSSSQTAVPPVIFSPEFDNLLSSNYIKNVSGLKNAAEIRGRESEDGTVEIIESYGDEVGLARRELFVDCGSISDKDDEGNVDDALYQARCDEEASSKLQETALNEAFDADIDPNSVQFMLDQDYSLGDIVQVRNEYGQEGRLRISELSRTEDDSGFYVNPTFMSIVE